MNFSWTFGDNWPNNGEIDIIEGVHIQSFNNMALHTSAGCMISGAGHTGTTITKNCDVNAPGQDANVGCAVHDYNAQSYGAGWNGGGGGVYAMEWTSGHIKVWWWPRHAVPPDALGKTPEPYGWGPPAAMFRGDCVINDKFREHKIVFDITFCGDWAGNVWGQSGW